MDQIPAKFLKETVASTVQNYKFVIINKPAMDHIPTKFLKETVASTVQNYKFVTKTILIPRRM